MPPKSFSAGILNTLKITSEIRPDFELCQHCLQSFRGCEITSEEPALLC